MKGTRIPYSADERAFVSDNRTLPIGELHAAFVAGFARADVSAQNLNAMRKRNGWRTGRTGRFPKGNEPWTKGKVGVVSEAFKRTQFKKGQRPHNTKYVGHERVNREGYIEISVEETNPRTGFERRYVHKHVWLWTQANGPVPEGMCLKCLDGDKLNTDPSNWAPIPRAIIPRLNGGRGRRTPYDAAPAELKPTIMLVARVEHAVRETRKKNGA